MNDLTDLLEPSDVGRERLMRILHDDTTTQIFANSHDRVFYTGGDGQTKAIEKVFTPETYIAWVNELMALTDAGYPDVTTAKTGVIEGSFDQGIGSLQGSIHVVTRELSAGDPSVTVRKQPRNIVRLEDMVRSGMMSPPMFDFLELAVRGRANILVAGGSGAGKTTLLKAMSWVIPPNERVVTCEDIRELHFEDRLRNVAAMSTHRRRDEEGRLIRETSLTDLVESALRMRPHRIIVGETRGKEALALSKAMTTGHDGSWTTVHADNSKAAIQQMVGYLIEAKLPENVARDRVANSFHLAVQLSTGKMGQRKMTEITELQAVSEGTNQRRNPLFAWDARAETFRSLERPSPQLVEHLQRYGVNLDQLPGPR